MARPTIALLACALALVAAGPASAAEPWGSALMPEEGWRIQQGNEFNPFIDSGYYENTWPDQPAPPSYINVARSPEVGPDGILLESNLVEVFPHNYGEGTARGLWRWVIGTYWWQAVGGTPGDVWFSAPRRMAVFPNGQVDIHVVKPTAEALAKTTGHVRSLKIGGREAAEGNGYDQTSHWVVKGFLYDGVINVRVDSSSGRRMRIATFHGARGKVRCLKKSEKPVKCVKPVKNLRSTQP
ncbi:MAG: hypothetical protein QOG62_2838, partial [Thermoleophilaceae bacterium]|nr:hypothetical protein [Thermoleophilaceae bacterium]